MGSIAFIVEGGLMLEVEMKFAVEDAGRLRAALEAVGARQSEPRAEVDHYFNAPDRDFARTDEAFRLRQIGERNVLTYKGPKVDTQTKTRFEVETPLADGPAAAEQGLALLKALRYRPTAVIRKQRTALELHWKSFHLEATLDAVEGVGLFAELEILAPEDQLKPARQAVLELAKQLGLATSERRS